MRVVIGAEGQLHGRELVHREVGDALDVAQVLDEVDSLVERAHAPKRGDAGGSGIEDDMLHDDPLMADAKLRTRFMSARSSPGLRTFV